MERYPGSGTGSRMVAGQGQSHQGSVPAASHPGKYPLQETATPLPGYAPSSRPSQNSINDLSNTSGASSLGDNQLEVGIDSDIIKAAHDVKEEVKGESVGEDAPFDPNLECPTCGRRFKIGQIQMFRQHAASCNNKKQ